MATWSEWQNAGTKMKIVTFGDLTYGSSSDSIATASTVVGFEHYMTAVHTVSFTDSDVIDMFESGGTVHCAIIADNYRTGRYSTDYGGDNHKTNKSITAELIDDEVVITITSTIYTAGMVFDTLALIGLSVLFVSE